MDRLQSDMADREIIRRKVPMLKDQELEDVYDDFVRKRDDGFAANLQERVSPSLLSKIISNALVVYWTP